MRARRRFASPSMLIAPIHARFRRLNRIVLVVNRGGGTGEIVNLVDLHIERKRDVVPHYSNEELSKSGAKFSRLPVK